MFEVLRFLFSHPLTQNSKLKALGRFLWWQIRCRVSNEIIYPWVGGTKLSVRRGMRGATGNIYVGLHEFTEMLFLLHFLRPGDLFLDIGSNVGSYSVLASGVCGARSWAFEPDPETASKLARNLDINALQNIVTIYNVALGPANGDVGFTTGRDTENRIAEPGDRNARIVPQQCLDTLIQNNAPTMMKLDVEDYEDAVLDGAKLCVSNKSLLVIQGGGSQYFEKFLRQEGYKRVYYDPYRRKLLNDPIGLPSANVLFVRDDPDIATRLRDASPVSVLGQSI